MQPHTEQRNRKSRILFAAIGEFSVNGLAGARTARIAERAGVNKQLIFYYFGSKRGLYEAVMRAAGGRLAAGPHAGDVDRQPRGPAERIRHTLRSVYSSLADQPELAGLLFRGVADRQATATELTAFVDALVAEVTAHVSEGQGLGYFRDDVDPELAGRQAVVLVLGYLALEGAMTNGPAPERRAEWLEQACDLVVRSLSWS